MHHEKGETFLKQFRSEVEKFTMTIKECGNPFSEDSKDCLIVLHTGSLKKGVSVDNVMKIALNRNGDLDDFFRYENQEFSPIYLSVQ